MQQEQVINNLLVVYMIVLCSYGPGFQEREGVFYDEIVLPPIPPSSVIPTETNTAYVSTISQTISTARNVAYETTSIPTAKNIAYETHHCS